MSRKKLSPKQFLLVINGPSCGGKSSVANVILEKYGGIFHAKSDTIKWLISGYKPAEQREAVHQITMATIRVALEHKLSVIKEGALYESEKLARLAKKLRVPYFVANVSAPKEVLRKRFRMRIEAKKKGARIANTSPKRFWELHEMYLENKTASPLEFDSSRQSPQAIAKAIVGYIQKHVK
jgi:predicted kinase